MAVRICMLLHEYYPNDIRVSKEASSLIEGGLEVHLLCLQRKGEEKEELINGIHVHRVAIAQSFFWRGVWDILLAVNFFNPVFFRRLNKLQKILSFSVIHVHDLPLAKTGLRLRKHFSSIKIVLDFHENYPEALNVWFAWKKNPLIRLKNKIFFGYKRWLAYEKKMVQQADSVIVVVSEMKKRLQTLYRPQNTKLLEITNSETIKFLDQNKIPGIYDRQQGDFIMAYTGNVGPHRGVDTAVQALAYLKDLPQIRLELTGKLSSDSRNWLESMAKELGVESRIRINGFRPFEQFFSFMKYADVNLIPHNRNGHTDNTIPHKLYQGMLIGKPVLVSSAPPLKRVVEELDSGLVFEAGNPKDFAHQIRQLYTDKTLFERLGNNGAKATLEGNHNWEWTGKELTQFYKKMLDNE